MSSPKSANAHVQSSRRQATLSPCVQARLASIGGFLLHPRPPAAREVLPSARRLLLCDAGCQMRRSPPEIIEMNDQKQQELLRRIEGAGLEEGDVKLIRAVFESYAYVTELIDDKNTSINRLRKLLFGADREDGQRGRPRSASRSGLDRTCVASV